MIRATTIFFMCVAIVVAAVAIGFAIATGIVWYMGPAYPVSIGG